MGDRLDLLCAGRACVDLYAEQDGARLEDADSFRRYLGGCAANVAVGTARMGLRTGILTGVGEEAFGRFVSRALENEGVDTSAVRRLPDRLTALVTLAIRPSADFPRLFYYSDSADMALGPEDVDWELVRRCRSVLITGSYLSRPRLREMTRRLAEFARAAEIRVVLDIDFRPVLWGLASIDEGNRMAAQSSSVTEAFQDVLPLCDLVVGTAEELSIAGGRPDSDEAAAAVVARSRAVVVMKRGDRGCTIYERDGGPGRDGRDVGGFPVDVVNSVGAGDAFLSGFLAGWLRNRTVEDCARLGNACGAIVASRHGCTPAMPTAAEVDHFLADPGQLRRGGERVVLDELHRVGTRIRASEQKLVLAFDHRWQLEDIASRHGAVHRLATLKLLIYRAFLEVAAGRQDAGILIDATYGRSILEAASGAGRWVGRALEVPRSYPLQLDGESELASFLRTWPADHTAKVLAYAHPEDPASITAAQVCALRRLDRACRTAGRDFLIELQPSPGRTYEGVEVAQVIEHLYAEGVRPNWWKLPPSPAPTTWAAVGDVIRGRDPGCDGIVVLGQTSAPAEIEKAFQACAGEPLCRGFAVGRGVFLEAARAWLKGNEDDDQFVTKVVERFRWFIAAWEASRRTAQEERRGVE
jgi:5-dehydro-2-deoxygluconokinase